MKRLVMIILSCILVFAGCRVTDQANNVNRGGVQPTPIPLPTLAPKTELPLPTATPDLNADPMNVVGTILLDANVLFSEDAAAMAADMGSAFGDCDAKQPGADGGSFSFISEGEDGLWVPLKARLMDFGNTRDNMQQAVLLKFQPDPAEDLMFSFIALREFCVSFKDHGIPEFVCNNGRFSFLEDQYTRFTLEEGKWYYLLMAVNGDGYARCAVWQDGEAQELAYYGKYLSGWDDDRYENQNWEFVIGYSGVGTLNIGSYQIMEFADFSK